MEFFLVKDAAIEFRGASSTLTGTGKWMRTSNRIDVSTSAVEDRADKVETYLPELENALIANDGRRKNFGDHKAHAHTLSMNLRVSLTLNCLNAAILDGGERPGLVAIFHDPRDGKGASIMTRLEEVFGEDHVSIAVSFQNFGITNNVGSSINVEAKDLQIAKVSKKDEGCGFNQLRFPAIFVQPWMSGSGGHFSGRISIRAKLDDEAMSSLYLEKIVRRDVSKRCRTMLTEGACADLVIITGNGEEIKCHKAFLSVSSDVFKAMFETEMVESTRNTVNLPDTSGDGVRAFLGFIYHWDLKEASKRVGIAVELLRIAHKYAVTDLEMAMQDIICAKPMDWFTVDEALKLLMFARNLEVDNGKDKMKGRGIQVLKWFASTSRDNILNSQEFQTLFREHPQAALELCVLFMEAE